MIRGIRKDMVLLRLRDDPYFEEAHFILRPRRKEPPADGRAVVAEAHRILRECRGEKPRQKRAAGRFWLPFLWGAASGGLTVGLCWILALLLL